MIVILAILQVASLNVVNRIDAMTDKPVIGMVLSSGDKRLVVACDADIATLNVYVTGRLNFYTLRAPVTYRFDQSEASEGFWDQRFDRADLDKGSNAHFLRRLVRSSRVVFRATETVTGQTDLTFQYGDIIADVRAAMARVVANCPRDKVARQIADALSEPAPSDE